MITKKVKTATNKNHPVKSRLEVQPSSPTKKDENKTKINDYPKISDMGLMGPISKNISRLFEEPRINSPVPVFNNQDEVNFYIAKLLSENESLRKEKLIWRENEMENQKLENLKYEKSGNVDVAKLRFQIAKWQQEVIQERGTIHFRTILTANFLFKS